MFDVCASHAITEEISFVLFAVRRQSHGMVVGIHTGRKWTQSHVKHRQDSSSNARPTVGARR